MRASDTASDEIKVRNSGVRVWRKWLEDEIESSLDPTSRQIGKFSIAGVSMATKSFHLPPVRFDMSHLPFTNTAYRFPTIISPILCQGQITFETNRTTGLGQLVLRWLEERGWSVLVQRPFKCPVTWNVSINAALDSASRELGQIDVLR